MARYSGPEDINDRFFEKMGEEYHETAEEYIDIIVRDAQIDPNKLTK